MIENTERGCIMLSDATVGLWMFELPDNRGNWLASLMRCSDQSFQLDYRFRYYEDKKIGRESKDRRVWFRGTMKDTTESRAIEMVRDVWKFMLRVSDTGISWELLKGSMSQEEFVDALMHQPGMHFSPESLN